MVGEGVLQSDHGRASRRLAYRTPGAGPMPGQNYITAQPILYGRGGVLLAQPDPGQAPHSQCRARLEKQPVCVGFVQ